MTSTPPEPDPENTPDNSRLVLTTGIMRTDGPTALPPARGPTVLTQTAVRECTGFCVAAGAVPEFP